jgi:ATP/maltotriose-dependent transcriptional regulator MalT
VEVAHAAGVPSIEAHVRVDLATLAIARGELASAEDQLRSAAQLAADHDETWAEAMALNVLGDVLRARGDVDGADGAYRRALPSLQAMNGNHPPEGMLHNLAYVALARGDARGAVTLFFDSVDRYRAIGGDWRGLAECAVGLAVAALRFHQPELAARLFGAADATLEQLGTCISPVNRADYDRGRAELTASLTPERAARAEADGRATRLEQVLDQARSLATAPATAVQLGDLTPRELEVAELLSRGLRNRDIADALVITEKTAANHVQRVLDKLGVDSRAQVAARAAEFGLSPR